MQNHESESNTGRNNIHIDLFANDFSNNSTDVLSMCSGSKKSHSVIDSTEICTDNNKDDNNYDSSKFSAINNNNNENIENLNNNNGNILEFVMVKNFFFIVPAGNIMIFLMITIMIIIIEFRTKKYYL